VRGQKRFQRNRVLKGSGGFILAEAQTLENIIAGFAV
jgi:hypothetical protein